MQARKQLKKLEDIIQCRKRVEKAFESEKLAAVLLRCRRGIAFIPQLPKYYILPVSDPIYQNIISGITLRINSPGGSAVQVRKKFDDHKEMLLHIILLSLNCWPPT